MIEKRFRVIIGDENDVRFVDSVDNRQLIAISFKDYKDAVDCRDALLYQCNLMNKLHEENKALKSDLGHTKVLLKSMENSYSGLLRLVHGFNGDAE